MLMTIGESLALWMLLQQHESDLSYIKKLIKMILQTRDPYTIILTYRLQKH